MKIALLGATGRTGRLVLSAGLGRGHQITALVRDPHLVDSLGALATRTVCGDGTDPAAVTDAVAGQDAIVVAVSSRGAKISVTSAVARAVLTAAETGGVSRLVFTSTYGMVATRPILLAGILRRVFAEPFREQRLADEAVSSSSSDWTILRATRLTDQPESGLVRVTDEPLTSGPFSLSRADLAQKLLELVERDQGIRTVLNISGARK
ncbi:MAG: NAD(P)-dependent oxidoreductase [Jatrophihabitans sp.]